MRARQSAFPAFGLRAGVHQLIPRPQQLVQQFDAQDAAVGCDDGRLYVLDAADGREVWSCEIGAALTGSPAVVDGWIIIGAEDGWIYAFGS